MKILQQIHNDAFMNMWIEMRERQELTPERDTRSVCMMTFSGWLDVYKMARWMTRRRNKGIEA